MNEFSRLIAAVVSLYFSVFALGFAVGGTLVGLVSGAVMFTVLCAALSIATAVQAGSRRLAAVRTPRVPASKLASASSALPARSSMSDYMRTDLHFAGSRRGRGGRKARSRILILRNSHSSECDEAGTIQTISEFYRNLIHQVWPAPASAYLQ
jgi:hypothetical protein